MSILLWAGSGWKLNLTGHPEYTYVGTFVCVDSLPRIAHYEPGQAGYPKAKDEESFITAIIDSLKKYGSYVSMSRDGDLLHFKLTRDRNLYYFINTTLEELLTDEWENLCELVNPKWIEYFCADGYDYELTMSTEELRSYFKRLHTIRQKNW